MSKLRWLFLGYVLCAGAASAQTGEYLFDTLKRPAFKKAWNAMLAGGGRVPPWVIAFGKGGNGVANPATAVTISGQAYQLGNVCKAHDCGGNEVHVLFAPGGTQAWGLLLETGKPPRFLGGPDAAQQMVLEDDAK